MAIIAGVTVNWTVSPRIVQIPDPLVEATVEDLQDTMLDLEATEQGMLYPHLRNTSGGEDLGGGVSVGWTMELQNAQIQFEGRTVATESGAVSSNDTTGTLLNAVGGAFVTNGVTRGDTVFNNTTGSMATILSVTDNNNLVSQQITGGARTTWLNTDTYSIYQNVQCSITGGNVVAIDDVGGALSPVLQSPNTNVIRTSSSSATTQNQEALENSLYFKGIVVDNVNGVASGTGLVGTLLDPVKTDVYANLVAIERGVKDFYFIGTNVLTDDHSAGRRFVGADAQSSVLVFSGADVSNCSTENCVITGAGGDKMTVRETVVSNLSGVTGIIKESAIIGTLTLGNTGDKTLGLGACSAITPGVTIDASAAGSIINMDAAKGTYTLINKTGSETFNLNFDSGSITIDATCTTGVVNIIGNCDITDNSGAGCTVNDLTNYKNNWDQQLEGSMSAEGMMRIFMAAMAGKASGLDTLNPVFRSMLDDKDRIIANTDANGNRMSVTLDET